MSDDTPGGPRRWSVVVGVTVAATVSVILLEGLAFLTPPIVGLGVSVTVLSLLALWLSSPRRHAARACLHRMSHVAGEQGGGAGLGPVHALDGVERHQHHLDPEQG